MIRQFIYLFNHWSSRQNLIINETKVTKYQTGRYLQWPQNMYRKYWNAISYRYPYRFLHMIDTQSKPEIDLNSLQHVTRVHLSSSGPRKKNFVFVDAPTFSTRIWDQEKVRELHCCRDVRFSLRLFFILWSASAVEVYHVGITWAEVEPTCTLYGVKVSWWQTSLFVVVGSKGKTRLIIRVEFRV